DAAAAETTLRAQPWVIGLSVSREDGVTTWNVAVSDEHEAEWNLVPIALDGRKVAVTEFTRARQNLEDVFLAAVGASNSEEKRA
ncbi:MAG TPA: hypothetical protein VHN99_00760, partial [Deinococcales bacterium]|nr:hypothetical protein [Deinococcales bacterium]